MANDDQGDPYLQYIIEQLRTKSSQIIFYAPLSVLPLQISHIFMIIRKEKLHQNVFFILIHLCVSDIFLAVSALLAMHYEGHVTPTTSIGTFYTASVLFTLAINFDRYVIFYGEIVILLLIKVQWIKRGDMGMTNT